MSESTAKWLVYSNEHSAYWRPNSSGYTTDVTQAGRYSREEAVDICTSARSHVPGEKAPEVMISEGEAMMRGDSVISNRELAELRAAFMALIVACGRCGEHRHVTDEEVLYPMASEPTTVTTDHGPTSDAAACKRALGLAKPLWAKLGITKEELDKAYYTSIAIP